MNRIANTSACKRLALAGSVVVLAGLTGALSPTLRVGAQPPDANDPSDGTEAQTTAAPQAAQIAPRATITGAGAVGRIAKFIGTTAIGNSIITENSGRIGIGTTSPTSTLTVIGASTTSSIAGTNSNSAGSGVTGLHNNTSGAAPGVKGETIAPVSGASGVLGVVTPTAASLGSAGVRGINNGRGAGVYGLSKIGTTGAGVWGKADAAGGTAVFGEATNGASNGVWGRTSSGYGVRGEHSSGTTGAAVYGVSTASDGNGVLAEANNGTEAFAIWGKSTNGEAGHFTGKVVVNGDLDVLGNISKDTGTFKIDHPLDPANKYLSHSFVESPDMMNVYNGNVRLDDNGQATVRLPDYFGAINKDFRYQLTAIGAPGPDLYVAEEIKDNRFKIAGGKPGMKVSWQVTGIRQDAVATAHRTPVETVKPARERGYYLHPELLGQPKEKGIEYARYPKLRAKESNARLAQQATPGKIP